MMTRTKPLLWGEANAPGNWFEGTNLPPAAIEVLSKAQVKTVEINSRSGKWTIQLWLGEPVAKEYLQVLSEGWRKRFPLLREVEWKLLCQYKPAEVAQELTSRWEHYVARISAEISVLKGWLEKTTIKITEDDRLTVLLQSPLAKQWLEGKGAKELVADWLEQNLGWRPQVFWCVAEPSDAQVCESPTEAQQYLREISPAPLRGLANPVEISNLAPKKALGKNKCWLGHQIKTKPRPLNYLVEEERSVTVQGRIFELSVRELRSGRTLVVFYLTDNTDSITVKLFLEEADKDRVLSHLKEGEWVLARGAAQVDRYSQELTLLAQDINAADAPARVEEALQKRVELHLHTKMSSMDGFVDVKSLMKRLAAWGHTAVAITDHGVVQSFPEAYEEAKKYGLKVIYGLEGYLTEESAPKPGKRSNRTKTYHIIILAQNQQGLQNLYRLVSEGHIENYYRHPRLSRQAIERYRQGLLLGTACEAGELIQAYLEGAPPARLDEIASFYDFIEIQPIGNNEFLIRNQQIPDHKGLQALNRCLFELGEKLKKPVVATGDVHFLDPEDECYRRILQTGKGYEDAELQAPLFLRTTEEMLAEFSYLGKENAHRVVVDNPLHICSLIEEMRPVPEDLHAPVIEGAEEQITEMTYRKAREMYGENLPAIVQQRIEKELNAIINNGFAVLYLIAHKLVLKSNQDGYLVGSRGSVGSSLVATLTGITEVNPLSPHYRCPNCCHSEFILDNSVGCGADLPDKPCPRCQTPCVKDGHEIPFETFMGFKGDKVPDIDLNFSGEYQGRAHAYVEEIFGKDHVFRAGTITTIADRTAYGFVKKYLDEHQLKAREAEIARLVKGCTGVKRSTGQHPGGLMVVPKGIDIHQFTPVQRPADDQTSAVITTHFDYESISSRLVKLDILGHDDPTVIRMLHDLTGVDPQEVPIGEAKTMQLFSGVEPLGVLPEQIRSVVGTYGIPEFGTRFVRQMLEDTRPKAFSDLVRISGFSHGTDVWLNNAQDLIKSGQVKLADAISTRDDIMTYLIHRGMDPSVAFKIMEDVRKGKGVKPDFEAQMGEKSIPNWYIGSCKRIKYMFPKAHAVAYVSMAFRIAYFKVYYPEAFYASFFTVRADEFDAQLIVGGAASVLPKIEELEQKGNDATATEKSLLTILEVALEMYARGLKFQRVDLLKSDAQRFLLTPQGLLPPLVALQGLGQAAAASIVEAREKRPFSSVDDLRQRTRVGKNLVDVLREHGCLALLPESDQLSLFGD